MNKTFLLDRRSFLRAGLGAAGAVTVAGHGRPAGALEAVLGRAVAGGRPTIRLAGAAFGFPSPFAGNGGIGYYQMSYLYDTLLWTDGSGKLLNWLAKSFERSDDGLTYTFELRDNVAWSDGTPFTAQDVVFSFEYYAAQESLPPPVIIQPPRGIAAVTATGDLAVEIVLESPQVTFAEQVAGALAIVPEHVWSQVSDPTAVDDVAMLVGTGAYQLDSYEGDGGPLLYTARDEFFLGRPFIARIEFTPVGDEFTALLAGEIDAGGGLMVGGVRPDTLAPFEDDDAFGIVEAKGNFTFPLYWNLGRGGALADPKFRQACALAIDRKDVVQRLTGGNGEPGNPGFLAPQNPFHAQVKQYKFDRDAANDLLEEAGYTRDGGGTRQGPDGPLSFEVLTATDTRSTGLAEIVIAALGEVGIELTLRTAELGPQLFGTKLSGNYDMAILLYPGPAPGGPNADPDLLRQVFSSEAGPSLTGASGYDNAEFNQLANEQRVTFDEDRRQEIVAEMQKIIARDLPVLPLYYSDVFEIFRKEGLDTWYFTPGQFPVSINNKQLFITGKKSGTKPRKP